ncbi:AzlC family ABC transporter permease [Streptomyces sp. CA-250714]|uniref:AzlC family ABC transporter permease n=1 Tax=Streptomyces sp. CA-250714 TaxID=3240060 RepID=UPI003D90E2B9
MPLPGRLPLREIAVLAVAIGVVGISFGAVAVSRGEPAWVPLVLSLTVFAAGAQFASLDLALGGAGTAAAVTAGLVLNARLALFGFALPGVHGRRRGGLLWSSQLLVDQSAALALAEPDPRRRRAVFLACGGALYLAWNLGTLLGVLAGRVLSDPDALGLDAAEPMVLLALVLPALRSGGRRAADEDAEPHAHRRSATRRAALTGAALALAATPFLPPGTPVLLALLGLLARATRRGPPEGDLRTEGGPA